MHIHESPYYKFSHIILAKEKYTLQDKDMQNSRKCAPLSRKVDVISATKDNERTDRGGYVLTILNTLNSIGTMICPVYSMLYTFMIWKSFPDFVEYRKIPCHISTEMIIHIGETVFKYYSPRMACLIAQSTEFGNSVTDIFRQVVFCREMSLGRIHITAIIYTVYHELNLPKCNISKWLVSPVIEVQVYIIIYNSCSVLQFFGVATIILWHRDAKPEPCSLN